MSSFNVTVHGTTKFYDKDAVILDVPDISNYVGIYPLVKGQGIDLSFFPSNFVDTCPKKQSFKAECPRTHESFNAVVELIRGELLPPTKSGANAGNPRDPQYENNYKWEFSHFSSGDIATNPVAPATPTNVSPGSRGAFTDGELTTIRREMATNDRTGLMQAVSFHVSASDEEILEAAKTFANWLNGRTMQRFSDNNFGPPSPYVDATEAVLGLPSPSLREMATEGDWIPLIKNREDLNNAIETKGWKPSDCTDAMKDSNFNSSAHYLDKHPNDYAGLFNLIEKYWDSKGGDVPW